MLSRVLLLSAILLGALALMAPEAQASPVRGIDANAYGGHVYVSGGVVVPVRHRRARRRVAYTGGYYKTVYETRIERVWHEPEHIGYDSHGHAIYSQGHYDQVEVQVPVRVWVPRQRVVRRTRARGRGFISIGGSIRVR